ncbi:hypothetical protein A2335_04855 [Candidatus Peregrinibacteria bacterium RIFOXYB2_FULL_32_7]|nr:MAG: hypothetical protein A2335_04855 [Candidatus Peregrinibacteria bacterium RIFOXYB2_FULL_32_7]
MSLRQKLILVSVVMISFIALILLWMIFLNKGSIVINGKSPFYVDLGKITNKLCDQNKCKYKLPPGTYSLKAFKDAYTEDSIKIQIERGTEMYWEPNFLYLPKTEKIKERFYIIFPDLEENYSHNLDQITFLLEQNYNLKDLPQNFNKIFFSDNGKSAFINSDGDYWLFDVTKNIATKLSADSIDSFAFSKSGNRLFYLELNEDDKQMLLETTTINGGKQTIVRFLKEIENPKIALSPNGLFVLIYEKDFFYLVNSETKSRRKIDLPENLNPTFQTWTEDENLLFIGDANSVWSFDPRDEIFKDLQLPNCKLALTLNNNEIIFIKNILDESGDGVFVGETSSNKVAIKYGTKEKEIIFDIYNTKENTFTSHTTTLDKEMKLERFETKDGKFYFLSEGVIYEIKMGE